MYRDDGISSWSFLTYKDPNITHKSPAEQCHQHVHAWVDVPRLSRMITMVSREGTVVLGGNSECHGAPHSGLRARVQKQGL